MREQIFIFWILRDLCEECDFKASCLSFLLNFLLLKVLCSTARAGLLQNFIVFSSMIEVIFSDGSDLFHGVLCVTTATLDLPRVTWAMMCCHLHKVFLPWHLENFDSSLAACSACYYKPVGLFLLSQDGTWK